GVALLLFKDLRIIGNELPASRTLGQEPPIIISRPPDTSGPIHIPTGPPVPTLRRLTVGQIPQLATRQLLRDTCNLDEATPITALIVPNSPLAALLPYRRELDALCHVKREMPPGGEPRDTAIVVSHCLPDAGPPGSVPALHTAVLVSLEHREELFDRMGRI